MVYAKLEDIFRFTGESKWIATESNGDAWIVKQSFGSTADTNPNSIEFEEVLALAHRKEGSCAVLRFIHITNYTQFLQSGFSFSDPHPQKQFFATFLTSEEAKNKYPAQYEKLVAFIKSCNCSLYN